MHRTCVGRAPRVRRELALLALAAAWLACAPASAQRTITAVRSILDLGEDVVEDVAWTDRDFVAVLSVARSPSDPVPRRVVAIVVLAEHYRHRLRGGFVRIACLPDQDPVVAAAALDAEALEGEARASACDPPAVFTPAHPRGIRVAGGGALEVAAGYDDEGGVLVLGLGLNTRIGVRFDNHHAILLGFGAVMQTALGSTTRTYLGIGPALLFDAGIPLGPDSAIHLGIGNGFDYGESVVTDASGTSAISGVFPTGDLYLITIFEEGFAVGLRLHVAIPVDAPDLFSITGAITVGGETL